MIGKPRFTRVLDASGTQHYTSAVHRKRHFRRSPGRTVNSKGFVMSRRCDLTGKSVLVGHKVSHSNIKTKRRFLPNLLSVTMLSDTLGRSVKLRVSANALKTVDHRGGLDAYLLGAKNEVLAPRMRELKRQIEKKQAKAS